MRRRDRILVANRCSNDSSRTVRRFVRYERRPLHDMTRSLSEHRCKRDPCGSRYRLRLRGYR